MSESDADEMLLYVENATDLIYEVKLFEDFALVRPANPDFYKAVEKIPIMEFVEDYHEFAGDWRAVRNYLKNHGEVLITD